MGYILVLLVALYLLLFIWGEQIEMRASFRDYGKKLNDKNTDSSSLLPKGGRYVFMKNPNAQYTMLFFQGSKGNLSTVQEKLQKLYELGYHVMCVEYPGYGLNTGRPTEKHVYELAEQAIRYLTDDHRVALSDIIVAGQSIGSGPAIYLGSSYPQLRGVLLFSPFLSRYHIAKDWFGFSWQKYVFINNSFKNYELIQDVKSPICLLHGRDDRIIRSVHSRELLERISHKKRKMIEVAGVGHRGFMLYALESHGSEINHFFS